MAIKLASHAEKMRLAQTQGARAGSLRGTDALADLVCITTTYTTDGTEVAGDTLKLTAEVPEACVLVPALSIAAVEGDPGTALVVDIGTKDDTDAYASGVSLSTVGKKDLGVLPVATLPDSGEIIATATTATAITASAKITFYLVFRAVS